MYVAPLPLSGWAQMPMHSLVSPHFSQVRPIGSSAPTSLAWPTANTAYFLPFHLPAAVLVKRLWVALGATSTTDNWDAGIYSEAGVRIVSKGSTATGTANQVQFFDITDTLLDPGSYYFALVANGTTTTCLRWALSTSGARLLGALTMATAFPLPTTATFASAAANLPFAGFCTTASP